MAVLVSREQKISLVMSVNGLVLLVLTMGLPYWFQITSVSGTETVVQDMGLWKLCGRNDSHHHHNNSNSNQQDDCVSLNGSPGWITGPEVLECMSLTCAVAALGLSFRMIFAKSRPVCFLTATLASVAGVLGLAGALVFQQKLKKEKGEGGVKKEVNEGWCFHVNLVGSVFTLVSGLVLYFHGLMLAQLRNYQEMK